MYERDSFTMQELVRDYASQHGALEPDDAWILTPFDTWERNPHYHGPAVPHPEYDYDAAVYDEWDYELEDGDYVAALPNEDGEWEDLPF